MANFGEYTRAEDAPSKSTEITPTMSVASFESVSPGTDSETIVASSSTGLGVSCECGWDVACPADVHVASSSRLNSSSEVRSCGSCRLDDFNDVLSSGVGNEVAMSKQKRRMGRSRYGIVQLIPFSKNERASDKYLIHKLIIKTKLLLKSIFFHC